MRITYIGCGLVFGDFRKLGIWGIWNFGICEIFGSFNWGSLGRWKVFGCNSLGILCLLALVVSAIWGLEVVTSTWGTIVLSVSAVIPCLTTLTCATFSSFLFSLTKKQSNYTICEGERERDDGSRGTSSNCVGEQKSKYLLSKT